ncbi:MAG: acyltransferase family protein [Candidatus Nanopelagicales bacterium]
MTSSALPERSIGSQGHTVGQQAQDHTSYKSLGYVSSLDGVRAVAVLAVMLFHFGQGWLPGGYIGVDVFFVLSGFLITTLLVQNAPRPFRARVFWERRARRLLPALALMLVVVFLYAYTQPPLEQAAIRGQGIATVAYVNNWWLLRTGSQYFDAFQEASPLLHTWTLSVEEQWYVALPMVLLLLVALRRFRLGTMVWLFGALTLISAGWTVYLSAHGASIDRLYLGTDTRAQQLLVGGLLGVLGVMAVKRASSRAQMAGGAAGTLGATGLVGLLLMLTLWPEGRWVAAQLPLSAAFSALLIVGALNPSTWVAHVLAVEPLRRIGLISYGLYLWHWPIAVMVGVDQTNAATPVRLIATFVAAAGSYVLLEKPIRAGRVAIRWFFVLPVVLVALALILTPKAPLASSTQALPDHAAPPFSGSGTSTFFVGDSVSGSLWLPAAGKPRDDIAVTGSFLLGCRLFDLDFVVLGQVTKDKEGLDCGAWEQQWRADAQRMRPDVGVFVGTSSWQYDVVDTEGRQQPFGSDGYRERIEQALDSSLPALGARRVAITGVPCPSLPPNPVNDSKNDRARTGTLNSILKAYAEDRGYEFIDTTVVACAPDSGDLYLDGLHFSPDGSLRVWEYLRPELLRIAG